MLRNVSDGYNASGQVYVATAAPTASGAGDLWFDISDTEGFTQSLAGNGYTKLPNGLILQWCKLTTSTANSTTAGTWPVAFTTSCLWASASPAGPNATAADGNSIGVSAVTTTGFTVFNDDTARPVWVLGIGY